MKIDITNEEHSILRASLWAYNDECKRDKKDNTETEIKIKELDNKLKEEWKKQN